MGLRWLALLPLNQRRNAELAGSFDFGIIVRRLVCMRFSALSHLNHFDGFFGFFFDKLRFEHEKQGVKIRN